MCTARKCVLCDAFETGRNPNSSVVCNACQKLIQIEGSLACHCVRACDASYCSEECLDARPLGQLCAKRYPAVIIDNPLCSYRRKVYYCEIVGNSFETCAKCKRTECSRHAISWESVDDKKLCVKCVDEALLLDHKEDKVKDIDNETPPGENYYEFVCETCRSKHATCSGCDKWAVIKRCDCNPRCRAGYCSDACRGLLPLGVVCKCQQDVPKPDHPLCSIARRGYREVNDRHKCRRCGVSMCGQFNCSILKAVRGCKMCASCFSRALKDALEGREPWEKNPYHTYKNKCHHCGNPAELVYGTTQVYVDGHIGCLACHRRWTAGESL